MPSIQKQRKQGRGIFTAAGQTLQQQYSTGGEGSGKNEFINSIFHEVDGPSACIRILQNTSTSSKFISGTNQATSQSRQSGTFVKHLQILTNDPMIPDTVRGYKIPFILLPRQSRLPNSYQLIKERPNWPKEDQFFSSLFLAKKKVGEIAQQSASRT